MALTLLRLLCLQHHPRLQRLGKRSLLRRSPRRRLLLGHLTRCTLLGCSLLRARGCLASGLGLRSRGRNPLLRGIRVMSAMPCHQPSVYTDSNWT